VLLGGAIAVAAAATAYWSTRSACVEVGPGLRGEVTVHAGGKVLYFNGNCWTSEPVPPLDMPL
jgi:hypothetical protein